MLNYDNYRQHLDHILGAALKAADPSEAVRRHWAPGDLDGAERVLVVGAGKAGLAMGQTVAELAGERLAGGVVAVPTSPPPPTPPPLLNKFEGRGRGGPQGRGGGEVRFVQAGHPQPNAGSLRAGELIAELLSTTAESDLIVAVFSGGGSALLERLNPGVTLSDLQTLTDGLLRSGAPIEEFNCVRKHLSQIKGGGLARMAHPARALALILSDVIGDPLDVIASGPTAPDPTTVEDATAILNRCGLAHPAVLASLRETPKPGDPFFDRLTNRLVGSNALARAAAAEAARSLGFEVMLPNIAVRGEACEFGKSLVRGMQAEPLSPPAAVILGGETTVTVQGSGIGGRNQELALAAALALDGDPRAIVLASLGTDGVDGPTPAAGAIATPQTVAQARTLGLDPAAMLANHDAYSFFNRLGDCIVTGPTGTNVNDLVIVLRY